MKGYEYFNFLILVYLTQIIFDYSYFSDIDFSALLSIIYKNYTYCVYIMK